MFEPGSERMRSELIDEVTARAALVRERADDRIGCIWALKLIAESVRKLDETDRLDGFLPISVRPALMFDYKEAAQLLHVLREYKKLKGREISNSAIALLERLNSYFEGRE
jgi:hypothetical protein